MDLNPWPDSVWSEGRAPTELADHCLNEDIELLVLPCAWLDTNEDPHSKIDTHVIDYWAWRLRPLFAGANPTQGKPKETVVVVANRAGEERGEFLTS